MEGWTGGEKQPQGRLRTQGPDGPGGLLCWDSFMLGTSLWPGCDTVKT